MRRIIPLFAIALPLVAALGAGSALGASKNASGATLKAGSQLFLLKGCVACHTLTGDSDAVGTMGPDLTGLARRMPLSRIRAFIAHPRSFDATTSMPQLDLSARQVALLATFIVTPVATPTPMPTPTFRPRPTPTGF